MSDEPAFVRIKPGARCHRDFHGLPAVVDERRSWGVIAIAVDADDRRYPVRLAHGDYEPIDELDDAP